MIVKKNKGVVTAPSKDSSKITYLSRGKEIGVATFDVDGKAKGTAEGKKVVFITKGRGVVTYNGKEKKLSKSYVLILEDGTKYEVEGKFSAVIFNA